MTADPDAALDARLRALPTLGNAVPAREVVARARARTIRRRATGVTLAALAAAALVAITAADAPLRARGVDAAAAVRLEAVADGPLGPHPVDGPLRPDEAVVFRVRAAGPGVLTVDVDGARIWPTAGEWRVEEGTVFVGGDRPLAWTPDTPRAASTATATLCPSADAPPGACATSSVVLRW